MIAELSAIQAAAGSLKTAGEIVNGLISLTVKAEVRAKVIELQGVILAAQSGAMSAQAAQMELLDRVRELEGELVRLKDWEAEKQRYERVRIDPGVMVPALKKEFVDAGEPPHLLCPNCYQKNEKSVFQPTPASEFRYRIHHCPACNTRLAFTYIAPKPLPAGYGVGEDPLGG